MTREQLPEERFAEELLRRVLRVRVTARDDNSLPRMVDALFDLPDGRLGALEVTTIGDEATFEQERLAAKRDWYVEGANWAWVVNANGPMSMQTLGEHLPAIVLACERQGVTDPAAVAPEAQHLPAFQWLCSTNASLVGLPGSSHPGKVWVLPDGGGGFVSDHLDGLPDWLERRLEEPDLGRKLEKLRATGREEQHLFLRVHDSAMPYDLYDPLAFQTCVPSAPLDPPAELTGLWLVPGWKNPVLWWGAATGWRREDVLD